MGLNVTALNSGSNGNCYYVGNDKEAILVDAGISCREIEQRLKRLELSIKKVKAIFISHEHSDHIKGVNVLSRKHKIPVYITQPTLNNSYIDKDNPNIVGLDVTEPVQIGGLTVLAFPKAHDAQDPHSFLVQYKGTCVGVFTDIGAVCEQVREHFTCCHAIFLEANYDEQMLETGSYPYFLKRRIKGGKGHLSNKEAYDLVIGHRPPQMSHIFLSHISKDNNDPEILKRMFHNISPGLEVVLTSRHQEIPVFHIQSSPHSEGKKIENTSSSGEVIVTA